MSQSVSCCLTKKWKSLVQQINSLGQFLAIFIIFLKIVGNFSLILRDSFCVLSLCKYLWQNRTKQTWILTWKGGCSRSSLCAQALNAHLLSNNPTSRVVSSTYWALSLQQSRNKLIKLNNEIVMGGKRLWKVGKGNVWEGEEKVHLKF